MNSNKLCFSSFNMSLYDVWCITSFPAPSIMGNRFEIAVGFCLPQLFSALLYDVICRVFLCECRPTFAVHFSPPPGLMDVLLHL